MLSSSVTPRGAGDGGERRTRLAADLDTLPEPVRATFAAFAEKLADEGFAFLHSCIDSVGPVLTAVRDDRVVGAIGPMETMPDPIGRARLLPQYFGVLPEYRGLGLGRQLWRAATPTAPTTNSCRPPPAVPPTGCARPKG